MITYRDVEIPAKTQRNEHELFCDLCGAKTSAWRPWSKDSFDAVEVEVRLKEGETYPEGGRGTETVIDFCPTCFKEKFLPWLDSQGGKARVEEWDW